MKRVLIVEDELSLSKALEDKLSGQGLQIDVAHSGSEAIEKLDSVDEQTGYAVMLLDLLMPKGDGIVVLDWKKEHDDTTPVLILSNVSDGSYKQQAEDYQIDDYLVKADISLGEIAERVLRYVS